MIGITLFATLATLAAGKAQGKHGLRAASAVPLAATFNVTEVSFLKDGAATVIDGQVSDSCKTYLAKADPILVNFGDEKKALNDFKKQCKGVTLRAVVTTSYDPSLRTACTGIPQTVRVHHQQPALGSRILKEKFTTLFSGTNCPSAPTTMYVGENKKGKCDKPINPTTKGSWTLSSTLGSAIFTTTADWTYEDLIFDLSTCTITEGTFAVLGAEDLSIKGANKMIALGGAALLIGAATAF